MPAKFSAGQGKAQLKHRFREKDWSGVDWIFSWRSSSHCVPHTTQGQTKPHNQLLQTMRCPSTWTTRISAYWSVPCTQFPHWNYTNCCGHVSPIVIALFMPETICPVLQLDLKYARFLFLYHQYKRNRAPAFVSRTQYACYFLTVLLNLWNRTGTVYDLCRFRNLAMHSKFREGVHIFYRDVLTFLCTITFTIWLSFHCSCFLLVPH